MAIGKIKPPPPYLSQNGYGREVEDVVHHIVPKNRIKTQLRVMQDLAGVASPKRDAESLPKLAFDQCQGSARTSGGALGQSVDDGFALLQPPTKTTDCSCNEVYPLSFALLLILRLLRRDFGNRCANRSRCCLWLSIANDIVRLRRMSHRNIHGVRNPTAPTRQINIGGSVVR